MMSALKISADSTALFGLARRMTLSDAIDGSAAANIAGRMAKYLETSLASEKVVSAPRVISCCLPTSTTASSLAGSLSRSTMLPASFAACVPEFIATDVGLGQRRRVVGAVTDHGDEVAGGLLGADSRELVLGVASAMKSSTPASAAMAAAVSGLSPVSMTVRIPMARRRAKRSLTPCLTTSDSSTTPSTCRPSATTSGVAPLRATWATRASSSGETVPPRAATWRAMASLAPFADRTRADVDAGHARLCAERHERRLLRVLDAAALFARAGRWISPPASGRPATPGARRRAVARVRCRQADGKRWPGGRRA